MKHLLFFNSVTGLCPKSICSLDKESDRDEVVITSKHKEKSWECSVKYAKLEGGFRETKDKAGPYSSTECQTEAADTRLLLDRGKHAEDDTAKSERKQQKIGGKNI